MNNITAMSQNIFKYYNKYSSNKYSMHYYDNICNNTIQTEYHKKLNRRVNDTAQQLTSNCEMYSKYSGKNAFTISSHYITTISVILRRT